MQGLRGASASLRYFHTASVRHSSRFYNPKISQTVMKNATKNLERSLQYELERQRKEQLRRGPRTQAKNPLLYDNRRTKVFNRQFQENIGFVMSSLPDLLGKGIRVTKVNVTGDFSEVRVFWVSSAEHKEIVSSLLESYGAKIKHDIKATSGLGYVPRIQWVHDQNFVLDQQMDKLFEKVKNSEIYLQGPDEAIDVWKVASESLELESDGAGLDRDVLIGKIETEISKKQALHRSQSQYSAEDFQTVYRETINRNGLQNKIMVKNNIKKFLLKMNIFRLFGDLSHLLAIVLLLLKIWKTRSCAGISGKSQILFLVVFVSRYLDLLTSFISLYNTVMKLFFIGSAAGTVYLMYLKFKATYDGNHDTFRVEFLLGPCVLLALVVNHEFSVMEILWTFSIYLESVAILPQLFMVSKTGEAETITSHYLFALGSYRGLYILNWIYRYHSEGFYDIIAIIAGCIQTILYCDFFYLYITKVLKGKKLQLPA